MTAADMRDELRQTLPEFTALLEEYRTPWTDPNRTPPTLTYGEGILLACTPALIAYAEGSREELADMSDEEIIALYSVINPVVTMRRDARRRYEERRQ